MGDGSFCNRTLFTADLPRTELIVRARRDLKLCRKADGDSRSFYDKVKFALEQVLKDESLPWCETSIFHGGQWRAIRYKEVTGIYWQSGAEKRPLWLFMVAPVAYQAPGRKRKYYRDPAFLLTTVWATHRSGRNVRRRDSPLLPLAPTARSTWRRF
jgi:hypothetical protein